MIDNTTNGEGLSDEIRARYEPVIGLEVHAQLKTTSKAFASVGTTLTPIPNSTTDVVVLAHPGTLPVTNQALVDLIVRMGLATNCRVREVSTFARKNYFYADLPKGYQISQFADPICHDGHVTIEVSGAEKKIGITRIHMEEDSGKSIHDLDPSASLVDLNRAGHPLIEIVSEPDLRSPEEAFAYVTEIRRIVRWLDVCTGNMEEGALRVDANISVRPVDQEEFGTRTEVKNLNSIRGVERAIAYEIDRQIALIESGGTVVQQTLGYDATTRRTHAQRSKEEAHDYRYFPEPDLPPVIIDEARLEAIRRELPELPRERAARFVEQYELPEYDASLLAGDRALADYAEAAFTSLAKQQSARYKGVSNLVMSEVLRSLSERSIEIDAFEVEPSRLAKLADLFADDVISSKNVKDIFEAMLESPDDPEAISRAKGFVQVSDTSFIVEAVDAVIAEHPDDVLRYQEGKGSLIGFFVGQTMKRTQGKANPKLVNEVLRARLGEPAE